MARQRGSRTGRCQGCNHLERMRIERLLAAGASIKGAARKFAIDYHALRRHWKEPCFGGSPRGTHCGRRGDQRSAGRDRRGRISRADRSLPDRSRCALQRVWRSLGVGGRQFAGAARGAVAREFPGLRATDRRAAARPAAEYPEQCPDQSRLCENDRPDRECGGAIPGGTRRRNCGTA